METNNQIHSFIRLVMNENLAQAQGVIRDTLNEKLNAALDEKFEAYAPAIFEEFDAKKADKNDDGTLSDWEKNSTEWAKEEGEEEGEEKGEKEGEEEGEEEGEQPMQNTSQPMQNAPQTMPRYSAPTGGASTTGSDGY